MEGWNTPLKWNEKAPQVCFVPAKTSHLSIWSKNSNTAKPLYVVRTSSEQKKKKNSWNDSHAVGTTTLSIIKGNRLHCWTNWLVIQLWLSNKKGLETEMVAPVQVKLCIKKKCDEQEKFKKKRETDNNRDSQHRWAGRELQWTDCDYAEKPEKLRRLRILRCRWPHTAHRARPATEPSSDLTTPAVWNY